MHLCRDERIGREVAMKVILPELATKSTTRARFLREASVQGQLEHPSIVPVHEIGISAEGSTFFTMKCVRGSTLEAVLSGLANGVPATMERFTTRRLLSAFVSVCLAVDFAHSRGVVHRDLKPSNVMLGSFGEVYLLDWGIAKLAAEDEASERTEESAQRISDPMIVGEASTPQTAAGSIIGTLAYMAPEQMTGDPASVQSDVFSLGAILFEILAGMPLRAEDSTFVRLIKEAIDARCSVRAPARVVAPELEAICLRATAKNPSERYESAGALSNALETYLEGDRDVVRRREQAAAHVSRARKVDGTVAMRELGAALALDPDNVEARAMVVEALTAVPKEIPAEVRAEVARRVEESILRGVKLWPVMLVTWIAFAPLLYWAGIRELRVMAVGLGLLAISTLFGFVRARRPSAGWLESASFVTAALAMSSVGSAFGPLVLVPTLLATFAAAVQLHPLARTRYFALGVMVMAMILGVLVAMSDVLPRGQGLSASALLVTGPSRGDLPIVFVILLANVAAVVTCALTIGRVRAQLTIAEERLLVHAWQVRGMMPKGVSERARTS